MWIVLAFLLALFCAAPASAQWNGSPPGFSNPRAAAASYVGPGDIATFAHFWGLRGVTAAYSTGSNPAVDLVDQAGANPITINILANGNLDIASINTWVTAHTVSTIKVTKLYDQIGSGHASNATLGNMPVLTLNALGSLPMITFTAASSQVLLGTSFTAIAQPWTMTAVAKRGSTAGAQHSLMGDSSAFLGYDTTANTAHDFGGTDVTRGSVADTSYHSHQFIGNGASSNIYVDGSSSVVSAGTQSAGGGTWRIGADGFSDFFNGTVGEVGLAATAFSVAGGGTASLINTNQHNYWGF